MTLYIIYCTDRMDCFLNGSQLKIFTVVIFVFKHVKIIHDFRSILIVGQRY